MGQASSQDWLDSRNGWLGSDAYSTAWVATVPHTDDSTRPAWPQALEYLRAHQLDDGGWGEPRIYYAHERTISTLAAIKALNLWQADPADGLRVRRGLAALRRYAPDLPDEPYAPIGFEMLLPQLRTELAVDFGLELPLGEWAPIDAVSGQKLALIRRLQPDPTTPQAWWFSMEMLPDEQLAQLDDSLLEANGSVATSTAATAAYLAARRRHGADSPRAAGYLARLMSMGEGGVPLCWPTEIFEWTWTLDHLRRIGLDPSDTAIASLIGKVHASWDGSKAGLSHSEAFPIRDGDHTALAFVVLNWAGLSPSDEPLLTFWDHDHLLTYPDERDPSLSASIHALSALRSQPRFPHRDLAERLTEWLIERMKPDGTFDDKWHVSPYYPATRAIPAFAGWDDAVALRLVASLLEQQRPDGGWGWFGYSTLEETAYCVIGLYSALRRGLLGEVSSMARASEFLRARARSAPVERMWIGKALYRPEGLLKSTLFAAKTALKQLDLLVA